MGRSLQGTHAQESTPFGGTAAEFKDVFNYLPIPLFGGNMFAWRVADEDIIPGPWNPGDPGYTSGWGADYTFDRAFSPEFNGTLRFLSTRVTFNERINDCTVYLREDWSTLTDCVVVIGPQETGYFAGTTSHDFFLGHAFDGVVYSAQQDIMDPDYVGTQLTMTGAWLEMESTTDFSDAPVHETVTALGRAAQGEANTHVDQLPEPAWSPCFGCGGATGSMAFQFNTALDRVFYFNVGGKSPGPGVSWRNGGEAATDQDLLDVCQRTVRVPGVYRAMHAYCNAQDFDTNVEVTVMFQVNGVDTNLFLIVDYSLVGEVASSFATDASAIVVDGDLINYKLSTNQPLGQQGGEVDFQWIYSQFISDDDRSDLCATSSPNGINFVTYFTTGSCPEYQNITGSGLYYFPLIGGTDATPDDENDPEAVYITCSSEYEFSALRVHVPFFSGDNATFSTFIDGAAGEVSVIIDGSGLFEDTTHTDDVTLCAGGKICYQLAMADGDSCLARINHTTIAHRGVDPIPCGGCNCTHECDNAYTLCELRIRTYKLLGEDPDEPIYWNNDEIDRLINDAYVEAARETKCLETIEGIELTANSQDASLSSLCMQIFRATFDDRKIENVTKWAMDRQINNWENQVGFIQGYITTLQDQSTFRTYKAWNGDAVYADGPWLADGAFTYTGWIISTPYAVGDRVTYSTTSAPYLGKTWGFVCIQAHTSGTTSWPGLGATWRDYWSPIALMAWATKKPAFLTACDEPELPPWSHEGLALRAAAKALRKYGEQRDENTADVYDLMAKDYYDLLKGLVMNRTPERVRQMGRMQGPRRPRAYEQVIEES